MNQEIALRHFIDKLRETDPHATVIKDFNKGRHYLVKFHEENLYVIYKRDFFKRFPDYFPTFVENNPDYDGYAESINKEWCTRACLEASKVVFLHDSEVYYTYPLLIKRFCEKHNLQRQQNKENSYKTKDGYANINEWVYNIPKKLLKTWE